MGEPEALTVGTPLVEGARVAATVVEHTRADKIIVFRKQRRKNYRRKRGHRQHLTVLRIDEILAAGQERSKKKAVEAKAPAKPKTPAKAKTAAKAPAKAKTAAKPKAEAPAKAEPAAKGKSAASGAAKPKTAAAKKTGASPAKKPPAKGSGKTGGKESS
jgi:large subunit ribosomal protein L21